MADEEKDDKTEQASQRRLEQAAEKGQIPIGRDASAVAALAAGCGALLLFAPALLDELGALVAAGATGLAGTSPSALLPLVVAPVTTAASICATVALAAVGAGALQTRGRFWLHLALPDPERLWQGSRLTRLVSREVLADLGLAGVKVLAVGGAAWFALRDDFLTLPRLLHLAPRELLGATFAPLVRALPWLAVALVAAAGLDLAVARQRFAARMRMTRDELKREHKEDEGDPLLRSQRRRRHREMAKARVVVEVPQADALLVNPTHVAVAIRYRRGSDRAPRVVAKGKGQLAEIMRDIARANGVAIVEDVPLARLLYRRVKVGKEIPEETYKAVAAILAFVYRLRRGAA
ncbi:flagellar biosynthesis protein FlhB [Vulgatibacter sp.]|uniref:EscU/YscU/HrcU family type III secretion system export apparatus switch protein n=1 Tax=Vulgatibacter sp. TaxID=1971226 RepID=UPI0035692C0F